MQQRESNSGPLQRGIPSNHGAPALCTTDAPDKLLLLNIHLLPVSDVNGGKLIIRIFDMLIRVSSLTMRGSLVPTGHMSSMFVTN